MKIFITGVIGSWVFVLNVSAQTSLSNKHLNTERGIAVQGYDVMCYFINNKAIKGSKEFQGNWNGALYYFSSSSNRDLFFKDPKRFEPQYGGWCAYAMGANNEKVEIDPETFKIKDGKLYLFYHKWGNNTLNKWNVDETNLKMKADKNWANMTKQ